MSMTKWGEEYQVKSKKFVKKSILLQGFDKLFLLLRFLVHNNQNLSILRVVLEFI